MNIGYWHPCCSMAFHAAARHIPCFIGGIVEHLNIEKLSRVIKSRNSLYQPLNHVTLVENRQLHCHSRPSRNRRWRRGNILAIREIIVDQPVAMQSIYSKYKQHDKIRQHHCQIKSIGVVNTGEGAVPQLLPVMVHGTLAHYETEEHEGR